MMGYQVVRIVNIGTYDEPCEWGSAMTPPGTLDFVKQRMRTLIEEFPHMRNELSIKKVTK